MEIMRILKLKSVLDFGSYKGRTVVEMIKNGMSSTILYYYYLNKDIDLDRLVKIVLKMVESDFINKPGELTKRQTIPRVKAIETRLGHKTSIYAMRLAKTNRTLKVIASNKRQYKENKKFNNQQRNIKR